MKMTVLARKSENVTKPGWDPIALTALLYLKEALLQERYEECPELIAIAKEFGVDYWGLHRILTDPRDFKPTSSRRK